VLVTLAPFCLRGRNMTEYKLARSSGTITVRLVKLPDPDWPCDLNPPMGLGLLQRQRVDQLPALPMGALTQWGMWMTEMFTHAENAVKVRAVRHTRQVGAVCSSASLQQAAVPYEWQGLGVP
jgi:hypothetical protein